MLSTSNKTFTLVFSIFFSSSLLATPEITQGLINTTQNLSTINKVNKISELLLGTPYADGKLGEGINGKYDKDPLYRFDQFDCTTFVETVMAVAISDSSDNFLNNINNIRYKGGYVSYTTRNHFPSLDWIPNNQVFFEDITRSIAGESTATAVAIIDKKAWYEASKIEKIQSIDINKNSKQQLLEQLKEEGSQFEPEQASLPYIPLDTIFVRTIPTPEVLQEREDKLRSIQTDELLSEKERKAKIKKFKLENRIADSAIDQQLLDKISTGSIINVVRPNWNLKKWIGTNMNVSHQGLAIRKNGQLYFRHASSTKKAVVDIEFTKYFSKFLLSPTLKGVNVLRLRR
ncbi:N-acetylmuramoyl-L-alanine amidase-like domain-containing protein [Spartinivicinus ruber]|uniref:N-acetylmuramoyl-L-alanine amidase-like domain-containing protein n=1 Tax=Spartinivicinus ruber TaxID=2683272 RepID=UPI001E63A3B3|nr:N-acetylmuramoyl-L-alanine amidase-like domain-containing protein [Spartinivicinus ruber]